MVFTFLVEQANALPASGLYLLDGQLIDGAIANGSRSGAIGGVDCEIVVKHVGLVSPSQGAERRSLSIERPPCSLESLVGCKLVDAAPTPDSPPSAPRG
jgi:hypothetical protein